jgi:hypothetical protein
MKASKDVFFATARIAKCRIENSLTEAGTIENDAAEGARHRKRLSIVKFTEDQMYEKAEMKECR